MAVPSDARRTVGLKAAAGTLYQPNCNCYKLVVEDTSNTAIDLRGEDDAVNEVVEAIIKELNPLAYFTVNDASGTMHLVMDKNISDATELQARIRTIGKDSGATTTSIGPNDIDISGSDVSAASSITIA
jgi:hypothetical protein